MTIRELMVEVEHEIEAARQSGAWEFDYHAAMEEVDALLNNSLRSLVVDAETVEEPEIVPSSVEGEEVVAVSDEAEVTVEVAPEDCDESIMERLLKGCKKDCVERTRAIYERILKERPSTLKACVGIARDVYAGYGLKWASRNVLVSTLKDKFTKLGLIEWDGQAKSEIVWL